MKTKEPNYKREVKKKMDRFVHFIYDITSDFPKKEQFSSVSQFRRAAMSIILNYVEGYARMRSAVQLNFLEISYGSLKECKYLLYFSKSRGYIKEGDYDKGINLLDEIGAMLWTEIKSLNEKSSKK